MAAYVIAEVTVTDPQGFEDYRQMVPATVAQYGGKFVVRGGSMEKLEGDWEPKRLSALSSGGPQRSIARRRHFASVRRKPICSSSKGHDVLHHGRYQVSNGQMDGRGGGSIGAIQRPSGTGGWLA